jgi:hypothetical protein
MVSDSIALPWRTWVLAWVQPHMLLILDSTTYSQAGQAGVNGQIAPRW